MPKESSPPPLPPLLQGPRKPWLATLVALGIGQAALGALTAWAMIELQSANGTATIRWAIILMVMIALGVGALRVHERVVAERIGQHYVKQIRHELVRSALTPGDSSSLGITVARTTNDLSAVRNWVAQGVSPLVVAAPLITGILCALAFIDWRVAAAATLPLAVLVTGFLAWAPSAYAASRSLRKTRGAMASRIAETVTAAPSIVEAGGSHREIRNVDAVSSKLSERAVGRAEVLGFLRATGVVAATLMTLCVAAVGTLADISAGAIVAAMALAGIASTALMDLGRVVEFRQSFLAARAVLGPALASAEQRRRAEVEHRERSANLVLDGVNADFYAHLPGALEAPLFGRRGEVYCLTGDRSRVEHVLNRITGLSMPAGGDTDYVRISGDNISALTPRERRRFVGIARAGTVFERGTVWRAVRYRQPELAEIEAKRALDAAGLTAHSLPDGYDTTLRRGGEQLSVDQRARLALARAMHGTPPLLVIDRLEHDLEESGAEMLSRALRDYPGVAIIAGCPSTALAVHAVPIPVDSAAVFDDSTDHMSDQEPETTQELSVRDTHELKGSL